MALDPGRPRRDVSEGGSPPLSSLETEYARLCATPSDIHEHLPTLRGLASSATVVVELGMRTGVSTVALAAGLQREGPPATLVSVDVDRRALDATLERFRAHCGHGLDHQASGQERWTLRSPLGCARTAFVLGSSLEVPCAPCDLLFVDTLHTADQLEAELERWSPHVREVIALHDTVTFGKVGEDGRNPGLMGAIRHWLRLGKGQKRWRVRQHYLNNNGLMVLERYAPEPTVDLEANPVYRAMRDRRRDQGDSEA